MTVKRKRVRPLQTPAVAHTEAWLAGLDYRSSLAKMMRGRFEALTADLGGSEAMSYVERSLCERFLWLELAVASDERKLAAGEEIDGGVLTQRINSLVGLAAKLGIRRKPREIQDLTEFLKNAAQEPGRDG